MNDGRIEGQGRAVTPYRFFSTGIFRDGDAVSCDAISMDGRRYEVGSNPFRDMATLTKLARYWRAHLELGYRALEEYDARYQMFIHAGERRVPVDHICVRVRGVTVRLEFTRRAMYVEGGDLRRWTRHRTKYRGLRCFIAAMRRAALSSEEADT